MKNGNSLRNSLLSQNIHSSKNQKFQQKEKENENNNRSHRSLNHFVYCSKYSNISNNNANIKKEINKKISVNNDSKEEEEGLDHPKPLDSDDENLEELKAQFTIKKNDNKKYIICYTEKDKNINVNKKNEDTPEYLATTNGETIENVEESNKNNENEQYNSNKKNKSILACKKNENDLFLLKNYKSEHIAQKQQIKIKNKINDNLNNNDNRFINNLNRREKQIIQPVSTIKKVKKGIINNLNISSDIKVKHFETISSINNGTKKEFNKNLNKSLIKNENHKVHPVNTLIRMNTEIYNNLNIGIVKKEDKDNPQKNTLNKIKNEFNNNPKRNKEQEYINPGKEKVRYEQKAQKNPFGNDNYLNNNINSHKNFGLNKSYNKNIYINNQKGQLPDKINNENPLNRISHQKEIVKKNSKIKLTKEEPISNSNILSLDSNNNIRFKNPVNILSSKILNYNNEVQNYKNDKELKLNKINSCEINKNKNILNKSQNFSRIHSNDIKISNLQQRHNIFISQRNENEKNPRLRTKSFEKGGHYNNIQTTYVVISKNQKRKGMIKTKVSPEIIDYSKFKFINPTPSANFINYSKLSKGGISPIYSPYTCNMKFFRNAIDESKKFGGAKSLNNFPVKKYYEYNDVISDKDSYETNYRSYMDSSMNRKTEFYGKKIVRNTSNLINKSPENNLKTIPIYNDYNYNYDYGYGYNYNFQMNNLPSNSYFPSSYNY